MFSDSESLLYHLIMKSPSGIHDYTSRNSQTSETPRKYTTNRGVDENTQCSHIFIEYVIE